MTTSTAYPHVATLTYRGIPIVLTARDHLTWEGRLDEETTVVAVDLDTEGWYWAAESRRPGSLEPHDVACGFDEANALRALDRAIDVAREPRPR
jgi:hypothetical protein